MSNRKSRKGRVDLSEFDKMRKEIVVKYFFDLSKLTFGGLVIGVGTMFLNHFDEITSFADLPVLIGYIFVIGLLCSILFVVIGYFVSNFK